jgi:hypothetical protein
MAKSKKPSKRARKISVRKKMQSFLIERIQFHTRSLNNAQASARRSLRLAEEARQRGDLKKATILTNAALETRELAEWHRARRIELKEKKKLLFPDN